MNMSLFVTAAHERAAVLHVTYTGYLQVLIYYLVVSNLYFIYLLLLIS